MNCNDVENFLPLYSGGELSRWRRFRVKRHLDRCDRCGASLVELDSTRSVVSEILRTAWLPDSGSSVWEQVRQNLPVAGLSPVSARERRAPSTVAGRRWRLILVPAAMVATSLMLYMAVFRDTGAPQPAGEMGVAAPYTELPPVVERIEGDGIKILDFETDTPGITIAWVFQPGSGDQEGQ